MRVIAGDARGRRLATLKGEATRPTLERVKEGVFSAVQFWLPGARVLDLFAGSGQLGLEALSRGAKSCVFVDNAREAGVVIRQNVRALGYEAQSRVLSTDAEAFLGRCAEQFDLVLLDPPYRQDALPRLLSRVAAVCAEGALVLCEGERGTPLPETAGGLALEKRYSYGTVDVGRYKYTGDTGSGKEDGT